MQTMQETLMIRNLFLDFVTNANYARKFDDWESISIFCSCMIGNLIT